MIQEENMVAKLTIPLYERVFTAEMYQNRGEDLLGIGLRSSLMVVQLVFDDTRIKYKVLFKADHASRAQCFAWSPETTTQSAQRILKFCTGGADHLVRIFRSNLLPAQQHEEKVLKGHRDYVNGVVFNPLDGSNLVSCSDDHSVILWDVATGRQLHTITFRSAVIAVSWHPEELSKLMIAEKKGVVHIFNIVSYRAILSLDCGPGPLSAAEWSLSNSLLIATATGGDISLWDLSKMCVVGKKFVRQDIVRDLKIAPYCDSVMIINGLPNHAVKLCNSKSGQLFPVLSHVPIGGISWHPKKHLVVVGHDEMVSIFFIEFNKIQS